MESREDEINRLKAKIERREVVRDGLDEAHQLYAERDLALTKEITELLRRLNLLTEQKGKFASPICVVLSHSYR